MKTTEWQVIKAINIVRYVIQDEFDFDGEIMLSPSEKVYHNLVEFLILMDGKLFSLLEKENTGRLPNGTIVTNWRNENNRVVLSIFLGENSANFFYNPKKGVRFTAKTNNVEELLSNEVFTTSIEKFLVKFEEEITNKKTTSKVSGFSTIINTIIDTVFKKECATSAPKYSPAL